MPDEENNSGVAVQQNDYSGGCSLYGSLCDAMDTSSQAPTEIMSNHTPAISQATPRSEMASIAESNDNAASTVNSQAENKMTLYNIQENEVDLSCNNEVGYFCGSLPDRSKPSMTSEAVSVARSTKSSRFGAENNWGTKPTASEETPSIAPNYA